MKKYLSIIAVGGLFLFAGYSCEKEQPAGNIEGNYTGALSGIYDGNDTINGSYPVFATATSKNKIKIEATLFPPFEVLVTQSGENVIPVSNDDPEVVDFLYQGALKELSFTYYKNGDTTVYVGTKP